MWDTREGDDLCSLRDIFRIGVPADNHHKAPEMGPPTRLLPWGHVRTFP